MTLFIVIVVLALIATYLLITSGVLNGILEKDFDFEYGSNLTPGMLGSRPSDNIDVFDSKHPVVIPVEGAINSLLESFHSAAKQVYDDFSKNKNSVRYKEYIYSDYKLNVLRKNGTLSDDQLNKYMTIRNTVGRDINNIFTYYLDKIKYNESKSYFVLRREIISPDGKSLLLNEKEMNKIENYVLSNTSIPGSIILLIKYKVDESTQNLIDQIVMYSGYNYTTVLEVLIQILIREPLPGLSLLGIVNNPTSKMNGNVTVVQQGFWSQVYFAFKSNNINSFLISFIKVSFMTEYIYRSILLTTIASLQNNKISDAINSIVLACKESKFNIIYTNPYNYTYALLIDAIMENRELLNTDKVINISQVNEVTDGISNIEYYKNIEANFPVAVQELEINTYNDNNTVDYTKPYYPILSRQYMINDYLSFPNISHRGVYFDRTAAVPSNLSGYIVISNTGALADLTIGGVIIYATLQNGFVTDDYRDIALTIDDSNVISNSAYITIEGGKFNPPNFVNPASDPYTTHWLSGSNIVIPAGNSIRIKATKQFLISNVRYLRIYAILIPFITKPISDFLKISVVHDTTDINNVRLNSFDFKNIPANMPNILTVFDSIYNITTISASVADTYQIFGNIFNNYPNNHTRSTVISASGSTLTMNTSVSQNKSSFINVSSGGIISINPSLSMPSAQGLITDTRMFNESNPNMGRQSFRIKITNNNTGTDPITINKLIVFGNTSSTNTFNTNVDLNGYVSDKNVLLKDTIITAFTMNESENAIVGTGLTSFIVDVNNTINLSPYRLEAGQSIFIEPTVSATTSLANRYVCVRAMYLEFAGRNPSGLNFTIISLSSSGNLVASSNANLWNDGALFIVLNPITGGAIYSKFTVLPDYEGEHYTVLPDFKNTKKYDTSIDYYYDISSELIQNPYHNY